LPHDGDPSVGEDGVEQHWVLPVPVADQVPGVRLDVLQVHHEVGRCPVTAL
jgi:hypothetical protein